MATNYQYLDGQRPDIIRMFPPDGKVIGSIGCGRGANEAPLVAEGREVHGVDVSAEAIETARRRLTSARVIDPDDDSPFDDNSLDGLILADVLEHLPMAWLRLQSFVRAVKPGGWVAISVPNNRYVEALWQLAGSGDWPEETMGIFDETHIQVMTHKRLDRWCSAAGLKKEAEFNSYHYTPIRRQVSRALHYGTFGLLKSFIMTQVQARYRRVR